MATCSPSQLVAQAKAFSGLEDLGRKLVIIQLLCDISEGSSEGGGGNSILSGPSAPNGSISATGPALYVQNNGTLWALRAGGGINDWTEITAAAPLFAPPPPPEPDLVTINRLSMVESRLMDIDHRSQAMESGIGSLHASVLGVKDLVHETDEAVSAKANAVLLATTTETERRLQDTEARINAKIEELNEAVRQAAKNEQLERVMVEVEGLKPKPVVLPAKKSFWSKLRDWSTNLFA
jgi:hypothetical protein